MSEQTLRWAGGWARLGRWRGHDDVAYLSMGADRPPPTDVVRRCLDRLRETGYTAVVTNALSPAESLPFVDAGFEVRERLHLLAHDMALVPDAPRRTRRARRGDRPAVLALDTEAFDPFWQLDDLGLDHALRATPTSRFRVGDEEGTIAAYAITGRAGPHGYIQRVAVHPGCRRRGWGVSVVADGLRWCRRHGVRRTLVNTQLHNDAALELYEACGFRRMPVGLHVLGRAL